MDYGTGRYQKIIKQNRKKLNYTIYPSSASSTPSYSYNRSNENTDSKNTAVLPPRFFTSIQTQRNSD